VERADRPSDLPFLAPLLDDDRSFLPASSSLSRILGSITIDPYSQLIPPGSVEWPQAVHGIIDIDTTQDLNNGYLKGLESPIDEQINGIQGRRIETALVNDGPNILQSNSATAPAPPSSSSVELKNSATKPKPRTRRRSTKPILRAPNPHGRRGKLRCELCRNYRQGVTSFQSTG